MPKMMKSLIACSLVAVVLTGCGTVREIDRTERRPHTAMRGPAAIDLNVAQASRPVCCGVRVALPSQYCCVPSRARISDRLT